MKHSHILIVLISAFFLSCNKNYINSIYPIPSKKLFNKELYYKNKYGYIEVLSDTVITEKQLRRIYSGGVLKKIGMINENGPIGYWFLYNDSLALEYILNYSINKVDSFYHPFAIVQQKW